MSFIFDKFFEQYTTPVYDLGTTNITQSDPAVDIEEDAIQIPEPGNMIRTKKMQMEGEVVKVEKNSGGTYDVYFRVSDGRLMRAPLNNVIVVQKLEDEDDEDLNEISNELLAKYKAAAGRASREADIKGDYALGHKRFKGVTRATKKQFANDRKKNVSEGVDVGQDGEIHDYRKLDHVLSRLCNLVEQAQSSPGDYGMVAAAIIDPNNGIMARLNRPGMDGKRIHAERAVIEAYLEKHGSIPEGSIILTTLSPCNEHLDERDGPSCTDIINESGIQKVYTGYMDPTQDNDSREFNVMETADREIREKCKQFADTFLGKIHENFIETVDVEEIHAEALREHLLSNPSLYENKEDFENLRKFLDTHATPMPKINNSYLYASIQAAPIANYISIAHFGNIHELVKLDQEFAYFNINGQIKRFPESGTLRSDALSQIYFFDTREEFDYFKMLSKLKFSDYKQTFKVLDQQGMTENFADGKKPGRKGLAKRSGVNTKASVSDLRKTAKHSTGEKARMAHWLANMKAGKAKKK
jgi:pyrimidine deaminase RibD-like protein